jgi:hypothetical protein
MPKHLACVEPKIYARLTNKIVLCAWICLRQTISKCVGYLVPGELFDLREYGAL